MTAAGAAGAAEAEEASAGAEGAAGAFGAADEEAEGEVVEGSSLAAAGVVVGAGREETSQGRMCWWNLIGMRVFSFVAERRMP